MFVFVILFIITLYLILRAIIKIKFHFWSVQPVFHIYDIHHWLRPNRVIESALPSINKYVNILDIHTEAIDAMSEADVSAFCEFIKDNFLRSKSVGAEYLPDEHHITEYMKGSNHKSYVSIYRRPQLLSNVSTSTSPSTSTDDIYSVISARILHITFKNTKSFPIYYIDNLCVNPAMRKKGIAPKAIQTLHYHLRRKNENVSTFLFKREGEMTAIVPLTTFTCSGYQVASVKSVSLPHASMAVIEVTGENLTLFVDFVKSMMSRLECVIVPEVTNIANVIKTGNISIRGILEHGKLIAAYVFRDAATVYNGDKAAELICSLSACPFNEIFYAGFSLSLHACCKEWGCEKVLIDDLGDNTVISKYLHNCAILPFLVSPSAFFLYNYVSYTFPSDKCFFLC